MSKPIRPKKHWLDRAKPKYWPMKSCWRVRVMRAGQNFQWVMKTGKSDPGSTGRAMATAEWNRIRLDIIKAERPGWNEEDMIVFKDVKDEQEHYAAQDKRFGERGGGSRATYMRLQARWRAMRGERQNGETLRSADRRRGLNGGNAEDHEAA